MDYRTSGVLHDERRMIEGQTGVMRYDCFATLAALDVLQEFWPAVWTSTCISRLLRVTLPLHAGFRSVSYGLHDGIRDES